MQITNKNIFYQMYMDGAFGNRLRTWDTVTDIPQDLIQSLTFTVRSKVPDTKFPVQYRIPGSTLVDVGYTYAEIDNIMINESAPDHRLILQGEYCELHDKIMLTYSRAQLPMRMALLGYPEYAEGLTAKTIIKSVMNGPSFSDFESLLELFPEHVIEFSVYDHNLGTVPFRNTIIWEVRMY